MLSHHTDRCSGAVQAIAEAEAQGGVIVCGGKVLDRPGFFVQPTIVLSRHDAPGNLTCMHACLCAVWLLCTEEDCGAVVQREVFVPILHVIKFKTFEEAVAINNEVGQGLSSSLFTQNPEYIFRWTGCVCMRAFMH